VETRGGRSRASSHRSEVHRSASCGHFARLGEAERAVKTGGGQPLVRVVDMRSFRSFFRQDLRSGIGVAAVATLRWTPDKGNTSIDSAKGPEGIFEEVGGGER
jgi:hypothetical protein